MNTSQMKTPADIEKMRQAGLILNGAHQMVSTLIKPGTTTRQIDNIVDQFISDAGAIPLFKGVRGVVPFPAATCTSVNEEVVHGIPGDRVLEEGDIISIDIGVKLNGWCADAATTYGVGNISREKHDLLRVTEDTLRLAIRLLATENKWSEIARQMQAYAEEEGYHVIRQLIGHGIGQSIHEAPQVPNFYSRHNRDFDIKPGLVIAVEPMLSVGTHKIVTLDDHWTVTSADKSPSAHFEHTIAITNEGPHILTADRRGNGWAIPEKATAI